MSFLLIFFNINRTFTEGNGEKEIVRAEVIIEAEVIRPFKVDKGEPSKRKEGESANNEIPVTFSEKIDDENNTRTIIFE